LGYWFHLKTIDLNAQNKTLSTLHKIIWKNQIAFQNHSHTRISATEVNNSPLADLTNQHLGLCSKHYQFV